MTACSWASSKWKHLSDKEATFVRVSAGRAEDERAFNLDNEELTSALLKELSYTSTVTFYLKSTMPKCFGLGINK